MKFTPWFIAPLAAASLTMGATADVSFAEAIVTTRAAVPQGMLFQIEHRPVNGVMAFQSDLYSADLATAWEARVNSATGALMGVEQGTPDAADLPFLQQVMALLPAAQIDFPQAIMVAEAAAPKGSIANKASFDIELGLLAFQVELNEGDLKFYVDAVTGDMIPQHGEGDDHETTLPAGAIAAAIGAAQAASPLPILGVVVEAEDAGTLVEVTQWDAKAMQFVRVTVDAGTGTVLWTTVWAPIGGQMERAADEIAALPTVTVSPVVALEQALAQYEGSSFHAVELKVEDAGTFWKVELITATGFELDVFIDATTSAMAFATAAVNFDPADFNQDRSIDGTDLGELLNAWDTTNPQYDLNGDGRSNGDDLGELLSRFG